jgi:AcrR family transcriptional regulator
MSVYSFILGPMARTKSEEKRQAILRATAQAIAERGMSAPTSVIAKLAGVAEGSIFTYFADKDALFNALYVAIKQDLHGWFVEGYPSRAPLVERFEHVWDRYIAWGAAQPEQRTAMAQLSVSDRITDDSRLEGESLFGDIGRLFEVGVAEGVLHPQPAGFSAGIVTAVAETTLAFMHRDPGSAVAYRKAGFDTLWRALAIA